MRFRHLPIIVIGFLFLLIPMVTAQDVSTVQLGATDELGIFLVNSAGMTLYLFTNDTANTSNCSGNCLTNWPALTVSSADELTADGIAGVWGVIEREDTGELQVTYNRWPLYTFANDATPGDTTGQGRGDVWFVVHPQTLAISGNAELGSFFVDPNGMTLYLFTNDGAGSGVSNCSGDCLTNWPALTVSNPDDLNAGLFGAAPADLDVIERADTGEWQVTYEGWPLYHFANDTAPGDTNGQGRGDVWFVVQPDIISVAANDEFGDILVGSDGMTLYTFANDEVGVSNCSEGCAAAWPPLTVHAESDLTMLMTNSMEIGEVGTITRDDGSLQVTLNGLPLYFFRNDLVAGDTNGHLVRDVWFVAQPGTAAAPPEACTVSTGGSANQRSGPGTNFAIRGSSSAGTAYTVVGKTTGADGFVWWNLDNGSWVRSDVVEETGACDSVATVAAPVAPTAQPSTSNNAGSSNPPGPATTEEP